MLVWNSRRESKTTKQFWAHSAYPSLVPITDIWYTIANFMCRIRKCNTATPKNFVLVTLLHRTCGELMILRWHVKCLWNFSAVKIFTEQQPFVHPHHLGNNKLCFLSKNCQEKQWYLMVLNQKHHVFYWENFLLMRYKLTAKYILSVDNFSFCFKHFIALKVSPSLENSFLGKCYLHIKRN